MDGEIRRRGVRRRRPGTQQSSGGTFQSHCPSKVSVALGLLLFPLHATKGLTSDKVWVQPGDGFVAHPKSLPSNTRPLDELTPTTAILYPAVSSADLDESYYVGHNLHLSRALQGVPQCRTSLAVRDSDRNDILTSNEYVAVINQLTRNAYSSVPYQSLPCRFREIFVDYAGSDVGTIDVQGIKPGQTAEPAQDQRISELCTEIISVVSDPAGPDQGCQQGPVSAPTAQPVLQPVGTPVDPPTGGEVDCSGTIQRPQCNTALSIADLNRDSQLDTSEYVRLINRLSGNQYAGASFDALPGNVVNNFQQFSDGGIIDITGSKPGQAATPAQDTFLDDLCCRTDLAVQDPSAPTLPPTQAPNNVPTGGGPAECTGTLPQSQCNTFLSIADLSRDNLINESEYVRFVNRLTSNQYVGASFSGLSLALQNNFAKFATTNGQVDVNGSKPGQRPTQAQADLLAAFCCESELATTQVAEPTPAPPPTESPPPSISGAACRQALAFSDLSRNDGLNEVEYVRFLNRLAGDNSLSGFSFGQLTQQQQDVFSEFAEGGEINIFGTKPGQSPSSQQLDLLDEFCVKSEGALGPSESVPTAEPSPRPPSGGVVPTAPPTFSDTLCRTAIASSDFNRDDYLNQDEFIRALNRLTRNDFAGETFETLDSRLTATYNKLVDTTGEVYIFGSKPGQNGTPEQEESIIEICLAISLVLPTLGGSAAPTRAPVTGPPVEAPPTLQPGVAEVFNSFIISNTRNIAASGLESGANRQGLDSAYALFASRSINSIASVRSIRRESSIRGRRLAVDLIDGSALLYFLRDSDCPENLDARETCQTVFGKFQVSLDDEDPQAISEQYTTAAQDLIASGLLQDALTEVDSRSSLRIVNASFPVSITLPPTSAPTAQPTLSSEGGGDDGGGGGGSSVGLILGIVFGVIIGCAGIGWLSTKFGGSRGTGMKDDEDDEDDDEKFGDNNDDDDEEDDASDGEKENLFGFGAKKDDSDKGSVENGNAFGNAKEQKEGKKGFGFGKKNKQGSNKDLGADNLFGMDGAGENDFGADGDDNMELFAFDDPSVIRENGDDQDGGSEAEKDNIFGTSSPGWGTSGNDAGGFFGSDGGGWGASTDDAEADNFFASSGFGVESPQNDAPGSASGSEEKSYSSSEEDSYESENVDDEDHSGSYSRSEGSSYNSSNISKNKSSDAEDGDDWDGIAPGGSFNNNSSVGSSDQGSASFASRGSKRDEKNPEDEEGSESEEEASDAEGSYSGSEGSGSASHSSATTRTEDREKREEYRAQVDALVRLVLPDEVEKVDAMMEQFKGREPELVSTLQTMQERSATQRARAAVHKSKSKPQRGDEAAFALGLGAGAEGAAAGTTAIAAASLPIAAAGMFEEGEFAEDEGFGGQDAFADPAGMGGSFDDQEGSYYDDEGSRSHSGSRSRSYYDEEGSHSGSRSYYSDEGSRSQYSGSRSQYSGEGSRSQYSGSRSQYSDEGRSQGSRSYYSGEEGSQQGSRSYYSEEGSQRGSQSYYSGEEGSQSRRSGSFYSNEEGQGSFTEGDGDDGGWD